MEHNEAFDEALKVLELEALYLVEATNDYDRIETFAYPNRETAVEVARALSVSFKEVAVHLVLESMAINESLSKTIYTLKDSDEDAIAEAEIENHIIALSYPSREVASELGWEWEDVKDLTPDEFATAQLNWFKPDETANLEEE